MIGNHRQNSLFIRLLQLLIVFFACFLLGIVLGAAIAGNASDEINTLKILQFIQSVSSFILPAFILAYWWSKKPPDYLQLKTKVSWQTVAFVFLMMIVAVPVINLLADLNSRIVFPGFLSDMENTFKTMEERAAAQTEKMLAVNSVGGLLANVLLIAIVPALGEELFFRGTMQRLFRQNSTATLAIWLTAFIFSAIHMQFYGFIPRMLMGVFFGYLVVWSGSMWLPIWAHFVNNFLVVLFHYLYGKGINPVNIDTIGTGQTWWLGCICGIIFITGAFFLKNNLKKNEQK
ncbi:CPBP family intramembrane metalloprotease [Paludibacter sp. 221]|uniref:CPBP family intramembrane glutamic endopeptidase n=1 Tax=Paludibacter sp. 221 TaxID=2302939 RepID=UPI0013D4E21E|nr:type II CAAX endopeptidase family protein [Paludibacter sp. 221]NDV47179.1 CPBP family intramembrane metalloprotease [Paludibacter sp. 221]